MRKIGEQRVEMEQERNIYVRCLLYSWRLKCDVWNEKALSEEESAHCCIRMTYFILT